MHFALLASLFSLFSVPTLSHDSVTQLVEHQRRRGDWSGCTTGSGVSLDGANRLLIGTLTIMWGGDGWVIQRYWPHSRERAIC